MGSIPLPALDVQQQRPPSALEAMQRMEAIKGERQQQQVVAQQQADQKAMTAALSDWDGKSYDELAHSVVKNGGSGNAAFQIMQHGLTVKKQISDIARQDAETGGQQLANLAARHDQALGAIKATEDLPDDQLPGHLTSTLQSLVQGGMLKPEEAAQYQQLTQLPPDQLRQQLKLHEKQLMGEKAQIAQAGAISEQAKNAAQAGQATAETNKLNAETDFYTKQGLAPGVSPDMASYADYLKGGGQPKNYAAWKAGNEARVTQPYKIQTVRAEAEARQQAAQGDPAVAGKMLAEGSLTLADIKTRGSTPQFIEKAVQAAQKIQPGYSGSDQNIAEQVAKSPGANQFFGSANSLITKGGTLDQLEELGKKIPQHDWPVLNTIDDWQKAARGSGSVAAYAATALGVADDYSKVMGGGTGSDTSRGQVLRVFGETASPEQRAQAVAATRKTVFSQRDSRIGNNQFLKRMYGSEVSGGQADSFAAFGGKSR